MRHVKAMISDQRGVALPLALVCLLVLTALVMAFLTVSAFEPQISANHQSESKARYVAEAGLEWAFDQLISNPGLWNTYLTGGVMASAQALPGLAASSGTFTVTVRNDFQVAPSDQLLTGVPPDAGGANTDTNGRVIVTATGTVGSATRSITAVVRRGTVPPFNAALAFPGVQSDVNFSGSSFEIRGQDHNMDGTLSGNEPKYGITVAGDRPDNEAIIEVALANNQQNDVQGRDETDSDPSDGYSVTSGANTVQTDPTLTSQQITDFADLVKGQADLSFQAQPGLPVSFGDIGSSCATDIDSNTCWGTVDHPKIVYIKGDTDPSTTFTALDLSGNVTGTGILIVEGGNVSINGQVNWNGPIIITGNNVGLQYRGGADDSIYGAVVVNELVPEATVQFESDVRGNAKIRYSGQALALIESLLGRKLAQIYGWREQ